MKILAFSDLHRNVVAAREITRASKDADVLIGAGDFANFGEGAADVIDVLKTVKCPAVLVSGNHDNSAELMAICSGWRNGHLLHGQSVKLDGFTFFGLGGEIPRRNAASWNEAVSEERASELLSDCPEDVILVTHTPPYGHADQQRDGRHDGSKAVTAAIETCQPLFSFSGHIHSAWGASGRIGRTSIHNLGPSVNWFEL